MSNPEPPQDPQQPPQQPPYNPYNPNAGQQYPGQQQYQPPYGQQYPQQQQQQPYGYGFAPKPPAHGSATTAMALGLIGLIGLVFCGGLTLVLSPFAWAIGGKAVKEIDANPGVYSGREQALAGKIMGIVGTVLLILGVVLVVAFIAWAVSIDTSSDSFD